MRCKWRNFFLKDPAELDKAPPTVPAQEAQEWCNFTLWIPSWLPPKCSLRTGTLRREAPPQRVPGVAGRTPWSESNASAYRCEVVGGGRRLRLKQFLYDWAFPALDHPCLWGEGTFAVELDQRYVMWFGIDYMGHRGASARLDRTSVELSVLEGAFSDEEILEIFRSLRPVDEATAGAIHATPFGELSYWARYRPTIVTVPYGLWKFRRPGSQREGKWVTDPTSAQNLIAELSLPWELGGYTLDSAALFADPQKQGEVEVCYTSHPDRGHELRLIAQALGGGRLSVPPEAEPHPKRTKTINLDDVEIHLAWIREDYGPFDAVWRDSASGVEVKLLSSTGIELSHQWFLDAVACVVASCRHRGIRTSEAILPRNTGSPGSGR